jgi:hypothetical protein
MATREFKKIQLGQTVYKIMSQKMDFYDFMELPVMVFGLSNRFFPKRC